MKVPAKGVVYTPEDYERFALECGTIIDRIERGELEVSETAKDAMIDMFWIMVGKAFPGHDASLRRPAGGGSEEGR